MNNVQRKIFQMREAIDNIKNDIETMKTVRNSNNGDNSQQQQHQHTKSKSTNHMKSGGKNNNHYSNNTLGIINTNGEVLEHKMNLMQFKASAPIKKEANAKTMIQNSRNKPSSITIANATGKKYNFNYPLESISSIQQVCEEDKKFIQSNKEKNRNEQDNAYYMKIPSLKFPMRLNKDAKESNDQFQRINTESNYNNITSKMDESIESKMLVGNSTVNKMMSRNQNTNINQNAYNEQSELYNNNNNDNKNNLTCYGKKTSNTRNNTNNINNTSNNKFKHNTIDNSNCINGNNNNFYLQRFQYSNPQKNYEAEQDDHKNNNTITTVPEFFYKTMVHDMIDLGNQYTDKKRLITCQNLIENYQKSLRQLKLKDELINKMMRLYSSKAEESIANEKDSILKLWQWVKRMAENDDKDKKIRKMKEHQINQYQVLCEKIMSEYNLGDINELVGFIDRLLQKVNKNDSFLEGIKKILLFRGKFENDDEDEFENEEIGVDFNDF